ncbi:NAD(P)-dependent oxidoreductase [Paracoccus sp. CPCC 101403]|uniref:NAD(P)-dependent oxidoreductase n=2 Tax=Paracoccus broussonetiae TaxID=3075834 RepID=A0ABU3ED44_9RHOB|nr:NAD(P)-dependent oxidoreductase [Paracoccus sp. CPCC 101403]MDT1062142.1 NAD(P)-dependent oxidoreductase [Paracoccus sp. CPCC 101403]
MKVGIIGVGLMGHGIARNVLRKGFPLSFLDHPGNRPVDEILSVGGHACHSPAEVARGADVLILCVTGSPQVEAVLTGPDGVLSSLRPGSTVIDCSTSLPESTLRMARAVAEVGADFLDAPMTRTARHAHDGQLNLLIGGDAATLDRVRPVLAAFTEQVFHVGGPGAGHRLKLLHNYVSVGSLALIAEAAAGAADAGIDPAAFVQVLAQGGGAGVALDRMTPFLLDGDAGNLPFAIANGLKDIAYYREMSDASGAAHVIADGIHAAMSTAVDAGEGAKYVPELARIFRRTDPR